MESLQVFDPGTEVSGRAMMALYSCMDKEHIMPIMHKHGLSDKFDVDSWHPMQLWLDIFQEIIDQQGFQGTLNLVDIGHRYADTALLPEDVSTLDDAIIAVNDTYQLNHRSGYAGELSIVIMGDGQMQIIDHTPYPCDFTYGMLYGLASRFKKEGRTPIVRHDDYSCRKRGDDTCTYDVTW